MKAAGAELNAFVSASKEASDSVITEGAVMEEAAEAEYDAVQPVADQEAAPAEADQAAAPTEADLGAPVDPGA